MKLKINHERCSVTYKEVVDNIQELKELRALPDFLIVDDVGGCFVMLDVVVVVVVVVALYITWCS